MTTKPTAGQTRRTMMRTVALGACTMGACTLLGRARASAQAFPERPITVVVGFAAGGGTDIIARLLARQLQSHLRQPVVVDNRPGAGGTISANAVAKAAADGYTLLLGTAAVFSIAPLLYRTLPYNAETAFEPLIGIASHGQLVLVKDSLPVRTTGELLAYLREHPGAAFFGSAGKGSTTHLVGVQFSQRAGVSLSHVPYRGLGPALIDLAAGNIDMIFDGVPSHAGGELPPHVRAIATTDVTRAPAFPDVPTLAESGLEGFSSSTWYGLFAPAGLPAPVRDALGRAIGEILADPDYRATMKARGYRVTGATPDELSAQIKAELEDNGRLLRAAGVTVD